MLLAICCVIYVNAQCTVSNPYSTSTSTQAAQKGQSFVACQSGVLQSITILVAGGQTRTNATINVYDGANTNSANLLGSVTGQELTENGGDPNNLNYDTTDFSGEGINLVGGNTYTFDIPGSSFLVFTVDSAYPDGQIFVDGSAFNTSVDLVFEVDIQVAANTTPTASSFTASSGPFEDLTYTFSTSDFGYSDGDGDPLNNLLIESLPAAGTLYVDANGNDALDGGEALSNGSTVSKANLDSGNLQYIQNGSTNTSFQFEVNDGIEDSTGNYTATLNVTAKPTVFLSLSPVARLESNTTNNVLTATLSNTYAQNVTVNLGLSGTASRNVDYSLSDNRLVINAGSTTASLNINAINDGIVEADETVIVDIASVSNGTESGTQQVTYTIQNDDTAAVTIADVSVNENTNAATITLTLNNAVDGGFSVNVSTADDTATTADGDYAAVTNATETFAGTAGETETFTIVVGGDTKVEVDELVDIAMSSLNPVRVSSSDIDITDTATLTILNDDTATVTIADVSGNEDDGAITVTVTLNSAVDGGFQVDVSTTTSGTATEVDDYAAVTNQTLTFAGTGLETETFTVTPVTDTEIEQNDTIGITMSDMVETTVDINDINISDGATVTIINDDFASGLQIDAVDTNYTIDFDNTVAGVNNGAFTGAGLDGIPSAGQLNSNGFFINGLSEGDTTEGGTFDSGDYARGASTGGVGSGGLYAFDVSNGGTSDIALGVQATGSDFTPGEVILKVENNTGSVITTLDIAYEIHTLSNEARSQSITLSHGATAAASNSVAAMDYATEEAVFTPLQSTWKANYFTTQFTGLNIADGVEYFIKWSSDDLSGGGSRDEFALDDIQVVANGSTTGVTADAAYQDMIVNSDLDLTQATDVEGVLNISGGTLNTNNNLTFKSINYSGVIRTAILDEVSNGGVFNGNVTVEQFYPANRAFRFVASSVTMINSIRDNWQEGGSNIPGFGTHITGGSVTNGFDQSNNNSSSLFIYDPSGVTGSVGWQAATTTIIPATPNAGARMMIRGDRTVSLTTAGALATTTTLRATGALAIGDFAIDGNFFANGQVPFGADGSFYLTPNPYQAQVDLSQTLNSTNSEDIRTDNYYAWQPVTENYVTYDFSSGGTQNGVTQFIQPGQSFFVQTDQASGTIAGYSPNIGFSEDQKGSQVTATTTYSIPEASYAIRMFDANLLGGSIANDFVRGFINTGSNNAVDNQDAIKIYGMREQLSVLASGTELSIERRDHFVDGDIMPLRIYQMEAGNYTFELEFNGLVDTTVELVDNHSGAVTTVTQNQIFPHSFNVDLADAGSFANDRFYVRFNTGTLSSGDVAFAKAVQLYPNPISGDKLNIAGLQPGIAQIKVTNMLGQQISAEELSSANGTFHTAQLEGLNAGIYLVSISQEGKSVTRRLVVE